MKRQYWRIAIAPVSVNQEHTILAASIVKNAAIVSAGQEAGPEYFMSSPTDSNTGKTFSSDWDQSF